jgi:hypothetical protein
LSAFFGPTRAFFPFDPFAKLAGDNRYWRILPATPTAGFWCSPHVPS